MLFSLLMACLQPMPVFDHAGGSGVPVEVEFPATEVLVDENGGTFGLFGDVRLHVPPGAVDGPVWIGVTCEDEPPDGAWEAVSPVCTFTPEDLDLLAPIEVGLPLAADVEEVRFFHSRTDTWVQLDAVREGHRVFASVDELPTAFLGLPGPIVEEFVTRPERVDVLFVVDDRMPMEGVFMRLGSSWTEFVTGLGDLDYHIGVVSTEDAAQLESRQHEGGVRSWIDTGTPSPAGLFASLVDVGSRRTTPENGRGAAYGVFEAEGDPATSTGFARPEASRHLVFVSRTNDGSVEPGRSGFRQWMRNQEPDRLLQAHAITTLPGASCGFETGDEYITYANWTGGAKLNVCASRYQPMIASLGSGIHEANYRFLLSDSAEEPTVALFVEQPGGGWQRQVDGAFRSEGYALQLLEPPPPGTRIRVEYNGRL